MIPFLKKRNNGFSKRLSLLRQPFLLTNEKKDNLVFVQKIFAFSHWNRYNRLYSDLCKVKGT